MNNCKDCRYWVGMVENRMTNGFCHRYPPNHEGLWARVTSNQWCGEYDMDNKTRQRLYEEFSQKCPPVK
jgi:hypothetical protein